MTQIQNKKTLNKISSDHNCERVTTITKLKNLTNLIRYHSKDDAKIKKGKIQGQNTPEIRDGTRLREKREEQDKILLEEAKLPPEKYVSDWVPTYCSMDPREHPLLPLPKPTEVARLQGGDLITFCHCLKRNGLQQDCPHYKCQGKSYCLTQPIPTCQPSSLGQPIPKPVYVSKPRVFECDYECREQEKHKLQKEKELRDETYINLARKYYRSDPPCPTGFKPCWRHDGSYVRKQLLKDIQTQTGDDKCRCMEEYIKSKLEGGSKVESNASLKKTQSKNLQKTVSKETEKNGKFDNKVKKQFDTEMKECEENAKKNIFKERTIKKPPIPISKENEAIREEQDLLSELSGLYSELTVPTISAISLGSMKDKYPISLTKEPSASEIFDYS